MLETKKPCSSAYQKLRGQTNHEPQRTGWQSQQEAGRGDQLYIPAAHAAFIMSCGYKKRQRKQQSKQRSGTNSR